MDLRLSVEAPKKLKHPWNKNAGCMKKYQRFVPGEFESKKRAMAARKDLFAFSCM